MKGAHHPGDIAERGTFEFALAQRSGRFALEIQNHKILSGVERLPEMVIAMNADLRRRSVAFQRLLLSGENLLFRGQDLGGLGAEGFGQIGQLLLQKREGAAE